MKKFFKFFFISILILILITISGFAIFKKVYTPTHLRNIDDAIEDIIVEIPNDDVLVDDDDEPIEKTEDELWIETIKDSDRVNILLFGTDGMRADTLIVMSYSKKEDNITFVNVPRDTQNKVEGKDFAGQDKINAVFSFEGGTKGAEAQRDAIEKIVGVPIHYYVKVNYYGLVAVVNTIGGVNVNVPFDMKYDDKYAVPELHIDLKAGQQTLNGDQAMQYIRWRKNNGEQGEGDLPRIKRQQEFVVKIVKKSFGLNILDVIGICYDYVKTDMSKEDVLYFGSDLIGFDFNEIVTHTLPGEVGRDNGYSYYLRDEAAIKLLMQQIYGFKTLQE